jgi:hypothetical protein
VTRDQKPVSNARRDGETAYELLLQQQQVYLQLELEAQQQTKLHAIKANKTSLNTSNICSITSPPVSTEAAVWWSEPDTNDVTSVVNRSRAASGSGSAVRSSSNRSQSHGQSQSPDQLPDQSDESTNRRSAAPLLPDEQQLQQMKVNDLKQQLKRHRLPVSGSKPLLVERLKLFIANQKSTEVKSPSIGVCGRSATFSAGCSPILTNGRLQQQIAVRRQTIGCNDIQAPLCKLRRTSEPVLSLPTPASGATQQPPPHLQLHLAPAATQIVQLASAGAPSLQPQSSAAPTVLSTLSDTVQLLPTPVSMPASAPFTFANWTLQPTNAFPQLVLYPTGSNTAGLSLVAGTWAPLSSFGATVPTSSNVSINAAPNESSMTLTVASPNQNGAATAILHNANSTNHSYYNNQHSANRNRTGCLTNLVNSDGLPAISMIVSSGATLQAACPSPTVPSFSPPSSLSSASSTSSCSSSTSNSSTSPASIVRRYAVSKGAKSAQPPKSKSVRHGSAAIASHWTTHPDTLVVAPKVSLKSLPTSAASPILVVTTGQGQTNGRLIERPPPNYEEATRDHRRTMTTPTSIHSGSTLMLMKTGTTKSKTEANCADHDRNEANGAAPITSSTPLVSATGHGEPDDRSAPEVSSESNSCELDLDWLMDVCEPFDPTSVADDSHFRSADREFNEFLQQLADSMSCSSTLKQGSNESPQAWNRTSTSASSSSLLP